MNNRQFSLYYSLLYLNEEAVAALRKGLRDKAAKLILRYGFTWDDAREELLDTMDENEKYLRDLANEKYDGELDKYDLEDIETARFFASDFENAGSDYASSARHVLTGDQDDLECELETLLEDLELIKQWKNYINMEVKI